VRSQRIMGTDADEKDLLEADWVGIDGSYFGD